MIATIALKRLCSGRLACSTVFENPAITMLQLCYNCAIVLSQAKIWWLFSSRQLRYFAHAHKVFCACPQGVLRMPARCFAYARKVVTSLLRPCYKGSCTLRAALQSLYSPLTKREVAPQVPA